MSEIIIRIPLHLLRELATIERTEHSTAHHDPGFNGDGGNGSPYGGPPPSDDRPWTDAQRRMVYRLVHQLGYEGEAARNFIATTLRLAPGETPGLKQASRLIDTLKEQVGPNGSGGQRAAS